ncbi:hypothetical protein S7711_07457 [Stachybotrys chartarum IBT 7711]|uniref:Uncharacterized protein n=1 Tax=Stachybotrys chartarum (strain CBS 109288 / IBT 7711) TaxID=1280523 RepID=A0A084AFM9_STACB|nr:hypothetical protein S7711_07457 [Stachybotrys chartarum IBT 7711]
METRSRTRGAKALHLPGDETLARGISSSQGGDQSRRTRSKRRANESIEAAVQSPRKRIEGDQEVADAQEVAESDEPEPDPLFMDKINKSILPNGPGILVQEDTHADEEHAEEHPSGPQFRKRTRSQTHKAALQQKDVQAPQNAPVHSSSSSSSSSHHYEPQSTRPVARSVKGKRQRGRNIAKPTLAVNAYEVPADDGEAESEAASMADPPPKTKEGRVETKEQKEARLVKEKEDKEAARELRKKEKEAQAAKEREEKKAARELRRREKEAQAAKQREVKKANMEAERLRRQVQMRKELASQYFGQAQKRKDAEAQRKAQYLQVATDEANPEVTQGSAGNSQQPREVDQEPGDTESAEQEQEARVAECLKQRAAWTARVRADRVAREEKIRRRLVKVHVQLDRERKRVEEKHEQQMREYNNWPATLRSYGETTE